MSKVKCTYCGTNYRSLAEMDKNNYICEYCVDAIKAAFNEENSKNRKSRSTSLLPQQIYGELSKKIKGQEDALSKIAAGVFLNTVNENLKPQYDPMHILIIGNTGTGKTYTAQVLSEILNRDYIKVDSSQITAPGYVGLSIDDILSALYQKCGFDIKRLERSIIVFDEIDKIRKKENTNNGDIGGDRAQSSLLSFLDGKEYTFKASGARGSVQQITINTRNMLMIFAGAFSGIDKVIKKRKSENCSIGYSSEYRKNDETTFNYVKDNITSDDLIKYGFKPEFIGRLPIIVPFNDMNENTLVEIIKSSTLKEFQMRFMQGDLSIEMTEGALREIAKEAIRNKLGTRVLRSLFFKITSSAMTNISPNGTNTYKFDRGQIINAIKGDDNKVSKSLFAVKKMNIKIIKNKP